MLTASPTTSSVESFPWLPLYCCWLMFSNAAGAVFLAEWCTHRYILFIRNATLLAVEKILVRYLSVLLVRSVHFCFHSVEKLVHTIPNSYSKRLFCKKHISCFLRLDCYCTGLGDSLLIWCWLWFIFGPFLFYPLFKRRLMGFLLQFCCIFKIEFCFFLVMYLFLENNLWDFSYYS